MFVGLMKKVSMITHNISYKPKVVQFPINLRKIRAFCIDLDFQYISSKYVSQLKYVSLVESNKKVWDKTLSWTYLLDT